MRMFSAILSSLILAAAFAGAGPAVADDTIKIGEINSYSAIPSFTEPYRKGWQLALDEINAAGGVDGKKLEVISKDDGGKPADAVTAANELVANDGVAMLAGTFFSNIGLAVSDYAKQKKILFLAAEPLTDAITLSKGNRYTFRLRPAPTSRRRCSPTRRPSCRRRNGRRSRRITNTASPQSPPSRSCSPPSAPTLSWVGEQWPPQGKIDAGAVAEAIAKTEPDAIFNVTFGADLVKLVREGETRGLFKDRAVVSVLAGEPEYLDPLKDETPEGWIVTGYPWNAVSIPDHAAFLKAYQAKYNDYPRLGSVVGYAMLKSAAAILAKAKSTDSEKLVDAAEGINVDTPFGPVTFRAIDHQSTLGAFVGKTALKDGKGVMVDVTYHDGAGYLPSDAEVKAQRPQN